MGGWGRPPPGTTGFERGFCRILKPPRAEQPLRACRDLAPARNDVRYERRQTTAAGDRARPPQELRAARERPKRSGGKRAASGSGAQRESHGDAGKRSDGGDGATAGKARRSRERRERVTRSSTRRATRGQPRRKSDEPTTPPHRRRKRCDRGQ